MSVLVTGGLGFIGSHVCVELLENNLKVIVIDNLNNSDLLTKNKIEIIAKKKIIFYQEDLMDKIKLEEIFNKHKINSIIHCAGHKAVGESINEPLKYYHENLTMTFNLMKMIDKYPIKSFVFSSSATVYGARNKIFNENDTVGLNIINPYGQTKYMQEVILKDFAKNHPEMQLVILRYFNPVGAHPTGLIGENPSDIPNNLMPYVMRVAANNNDIGFKNEKKYNYLTIFGNNYNTKCGTCIRDFIHVVDLAKSHVLAVNHTNNDDNNNINIFNIGTGLGTSVFELVNSFKKVNQLKLNYIYGKRREGDVCTVVCDPTKANKILKWKATKNIDDMVKDCWNFILKNIS